MKKCNIRFLFFITILIFCLASSAAYGMDIRLRWDPNSEPDLVGYKLYYKEGFSGPPYNGWEALEGDSPIETDAYQVLVGDVCEYTLRDLDKTKDYYFVVTAYDADGNESKYSNEVCYHSTDTYQPPSISYVWPVRTNPQEIVVLFGSGFGAQQSDSIVHIGLKNFGAGHSRIKFWNDTIIGIKIPFGSKKCEWWRDADVRQRKIWVTIDGVRSNKKMLEIIKQNTCPQ